MKILIQGIRKTVNWYLNNRQWLTIQNGNYQLERLGRVN
jgi:dTDP-D-glucose 4,6-dehydratase